MDSKWNWVDGDYHVQNKEDVNNVDEIMCCENEHFSDWQFTGPHTKPN